MSACTDTCLKPSPGTRTEHCKVCHQTFVGARAGDMHRTGRHGVKVGNDRRRCLTVDEMTAKGMTRNSRGVWAEGNARRRVERNPHPHHSAQETRADSRRKAA